MRVTQVTRRRAPATDAERAVIEEALAFIDLGGGLAASDGVHGYPMGNALAHLKYAAQAVRKERGEMRDGPIYTTDKVGYADPERMLKWQNESLLHPRLKAKNEHIKELEAALQAIGSGDAEKMLEFVQGHGAVLPEMKEIYNDQRWQPESYEIEGDYADDARYNYPNRLRLIRGVCQAALKEVK